MLQVLQEVTSGWQQPRLRARVGSLLQVGGCAMRQGCWITALSWAAAHQCGQPSIPSTSTAQTQLLLAAGSSDGSVTLFGRAASQLGSLSVMKPQDAMTSGSQATTALNALAMIASPDLRGVTCLHLQCMRDASGDACSCLPRRAI